MSYIFVEKTLSEFERDASVLAKRNNIKMQKVDKEAIIADPFWALGSDEDHDYSQFLACYKFDDEHILLFGNEKITDFKWLGNPKDVSDKLSNMFLSLLHDEEK